MSTRYQTPCYGVILKISSKELLDLIRKYVNPKFLEDYDDKTQRLEDFYSDFGFCPHFSSNEVTVFNILSNQDEKEVFFGVCASEKVHWSNRLNWNSAYQKIKRIEMDLTWNYSQFLGDSGLSPELFLFDC